MLKGRDLKMEWGAFIQDESDDAFYIIYNHYFHYLNYLGLKKGFAITRVKDSINDLFLHVWENRSKLQHVLNHHNYMLTIFLRKLYKNEHFSSDHSIEFDHNLPDFGVTASPEVAHIIEATTTEVSKILGYFVEQLPEKQRGMVYQKFYLGLSYHDIAVLNGVSINTVYNTIYKAVDKLKQQIGKENLGSFLIAIASLATLIYFFFN